MARYDIPESQYQAGSAGVGIIAARFNHRIVDRLLEGALEALARHDLAEEQITVLRVPGAFELPQCALRLGAREDITAVITLGCIIRGGTPHFDYVCAQAARGIGDAALRLNKPVIFGVLTTDDLPQAEARAGGSEGNKGEEAALAALEMISLYRHARL